MQSQCPLTTFSPTYSSRSLMPLTGTATFTRSAVAAFARMSADVEHRREFCACFRIVRQIEIARHIQPWPALKVQFLDTKPFLTFKSSRDLRIKRRPFRQWPQPKHFQVLLMQLW